MATGTRFTAEQFANAERAGQSRNAARQFAPLCVLVCAAVAMNLVQHSDGLNVLEARSPNGR